MKHLKVGSRLRIIITFAMCSCLLEVMIDGDVSRRSTLQTLHSVTRGIYLLPHRWDPAVGSMSIPALHILSITILPDT